MALRSSSNRKDMGERCDPIDTLQRTPAAGKDNCNYLEKTHTSDFSRSQYSESGTTDVPCLLSAMLPASFTVMKAPSFWPLMVQGTDDSQSLSHHPASVPCSTSTHSSPILGGQLALLPSSAHLGNTHPTSTRAGGGGSDHKLPLLL